jgi:predicted DNA-binding ArsR family transcriptional regulator
VSKSIRWLTLDQVSEMMGVSSDRALEIAKNNSLPFLRLQRVTFIDPEDLAAYLAAARHSRRK